MGPRTGEMVCGVWKWKACENVKGRGIHPMERMGYHRITCFPTANATLASFHGNGNEDKFPAIRIAFCDCSRKELNTV